MAYDANAPHKLIYPNEIHFHRWHHCLSVEAHWAKFLSNSIVKLRPFHWCLEEEFKSSTKIWHVKLKKLRHLLNDFL